MPWLKHASGALLWARRAFLSFPNKGAESVVLKAADHFMFPIVEHVAKLMGWPNHRSRPTWKRHLRKALHSVGGLYWGSADHQRRPPDTSYTRMMLDDWWASPVTDVADAIATEAEVLGESELGDLRALRSQAGALHKRVVDFVNDLVKCFPTRGVYDPQKTKAVVDKHFPDRPSENPVVSPYKP